MRAHAGGVISRGGGLLVGLLLLVPVGAHADTIFLKNGEQVEVGVAWQEGGEIKGTGEDALVSFPVEAVSHIEEDERSGLKPVQEGFRFDVWRAGMSVANVMQIAEAGDLPLNPNQAHPARRHFDPNVRQSMGTVATYAYPDRLLGKPVRVVLSLTPVSRKLFRIGVHFVNANTEKTRQDIRSTLERKYGKPSARGKKDL